MVFIDNGTDEPGFVDVVEPREMTKEDIKEVVEQYRQRLMVEGFDGIELHANGYLINQFIDSWSKQPYRWQYKSNWKTACVSWVKWRSYGWRIGADRVGVRLCSVCWSLNGTVDATPVETYTAAASTLFQLYTKLFKFITTAEVDWDDAPETPKAFKAAVREAYDGVLIYAGTW